MPGVLVVVFFKYIKLSVIAHFHGVLSRTHTYNATKENNSTQTDLSYKNIATTPRAPIPIAPAAAVAMGTAPSKDVVDLAPPLDSESEPEAELVPLEGETLLVRVLAKPVDVIWTIQLIY